MIANLVPKQAIPELATRANSPELVRVLEHIQRSGFVRNGEVDQEMADALRRLMELGAWLMPVVRDSRRQALSLDQQW